MTLKSTRHVEGALVFILKATLMTPLADAILSAATCALARCDALPLKGACRERDEDARAVAIAVLVALGGAKRTSGMLPFASGLSQKLLSIADELDDGAEQTEERCLGVSFPVREKFK